MIQFSTKTFFLQVRLYRSAMVYKTVEREVVMRNTTRLLLAACLLFGATGCAVVTKGHGAWEVFMGVRTEQISEEPASFGVESKILEKAAEALLGSTEKTE